MAEIVPCQPCPRQTSCESVNCETVDEQVAVSAEFFVAFGAAGSGNGSWLFESASRSRGETAHFRRETKQQKLATSALLSSLGFLSTACEVQKVTLHHHLRCLAAAQQKLLTVQRKYAEVS